MDKLSYMTRSLFVTLVSRRIEGYASTRECNSKHFGKTTPDVVFFHLEPGIGHRIAQYLSPTWAMLRE